MSDTIDNITNIKLSDITKEENGEKKLVFDEKIDGKNEKKENISISRDDLENHVNEKLESLWGSFFQGENKEKLKNINFSDQNWQKQVEDIFDTWIDTNSNVITDLEFSLFTEKSIDKEKEDALKKYLNKETLNLNTEKIRIQLESLKKGLSYEVERKNMYSLLDNQNGAESLKAKFETAMSKLPVNERITFKEFAENIHTTIEVYFKDLEGINPAVLENMNTGTQLLLMESLNTEGNDEFFGFMGKESSGDKTLLYNTIRAFMKGKDYLDMGLKLENLKWYLNRNKSVFGDGSSLQQLSNPLKFKDLLLGPLLETKENIQLTEFGEPIKISSAQEQQILNIANSLQLDGKQILKINNSTKKAQEILEKRTKRKKDITGLYTTLQDSVGGIMEGLTGPLSLFGMKTDKYLIDMLGKPSGTMRKIVDFLLSLIGFSGGLEGLHQNYIKENIDRGIEMNPVKKQFITTILETYKSNVSTGEIQQGLTTFDKISNLEKAINPTIKSKIPQDYTALNMAFKKGIDDHKLALNPVMIKKYKLTSYFKNYKTEIQEKEIHGKKQKVEVLSEQTTITDVDKFIQVYIASVIPELAKNTKLMTNINDSDDFTFAMIGNLVLDDYFVEGVAVNAIDKTTYGGEQSESGEVVGDLNKNKIPEYKEGDDLILINKVGKNKLDFQDKVKEISKEIGVNPNALMAVMNKESGLNPKVQNKTTGAVGLIQFMPNILSSRSLTVNNIKDMSNIQQLELVKRYYKTYKGKISDIKTLYLATFFPVALDHKDDPNWVFKADDLSAEKIASQNKGIDMDKNGVITMADFDGYINGKVIPEALV